MDIEQRTVGDVLVLSIRGDITMVGGGATRIADAVRGALEPGRDRLLIDLGHVRYVDSAGLGGLVEAFAAARNRGGALKLLHVTDRLNNLLVITRLLTVFECLDSEADAVESFSKDSPILAGAVAVRARRAL